MRTTMNLVLTRARPCRRPHMLPCRLHRGASRLFDYGNLWTGQNRQGSPAYLLQWRQWCNCWSLGTYWAVWVVTCAFKMIVAFAYCKLCVDQSVTVSTHYTGTNANIYATPVFSTTKAVHSLTCICTHGEREWRKTIPSWIPGRFQLSINNSIHSRPPCLVALDRPMACELVGCSPKYRVQ